MFETGLDIRLCHVIRRKGMTIQSHYLKLIFKSERSSMGIWGVIVLRLKGLMYFLAKEDHMNSDIYINQVLKKLGLLFYNKFIEEKSFMIWINNDAGYHTSKITIPYYLYIRIIFMDWPVQFLDLNLIENLW